MAIRVPKSPGLPTLGREKSMRSDMENQQRALYQQWVDFAYRINLVLARDGTERMDGSLNLQLLATADFPPAADYQGGLIFDTTLGVLMFSDGTNWVPPPTIPTPPTPLTLSIVVQTFTSGGTYTPTADMVYCRIRVQAPGGGSGGADGEGPGGVGVATGGGGGGEYAEGFFSAADIGASKAVAIGAAGTAGNTTGGNGGNGGDVSVGTLITALGGAGSVGTGSNSTNDAPRAGGAGGSGGTGGHLRIPGGAGAYSDRVDLGSNISALKSGIGGESHLSNGARVAGGMDINTNVAGTTGANYGGGASGAMTGSSTGVAGAAGGPGIVIIEEFIMS